MFEKGFSISLCNAQQDIPAKKQPEYLVLIHLLQLFLLFECQNICISFNYTGITAYYPEHIAKNDKLFIQESPPQPLLRQGQTVLLQLLCQRRTVDE